MNATGKVAKEDLRARVAGGGATGRPRQSLNGPVSFSGAPCGTPPRAVPGLGEHTDEVPAELSE